MQPKSVGPHHIVVKSDLNLIVGKGGGAGFGQFELLPFDSKKLKITPFWIFRKQSTPLGG